MTELTYGLNREHSFEISAILNLYGDFVLGFNITTVATIQTSYQAFAPTEDLLAFWFMPNVERHIRRISLITS